MYAVHLSYSMIKPGDRVLDIGGSASPFKRADAVLDFLPYEQRNKNSGFLNGLKENFTKETWHIQDVCDRSKPFPFKDKEFDFVNCGHLLEDVRDPFYVISEVLRVSKRGYFEVPSRICEQMKWAERRRICGFAHHRWFIDWKKNEKSGKNEMVFVFKNHSLHGDKRFHVKPKGLHFGRPRMNTALQFTGFYFNGPFDAYEDVAQAIDNGERFMLETVKRANALGSRLWDQNEKTPVHIGNIDDLPPGLYPLAELESRIDRKALLFDPKTREKTPELLDYENSVYQQAR